MPDRTMPDRTLPAERVALVDLLDRVLARGVVVTGDVTLCIADVDLVRVSLRALITSVSALAEPPADQTAAPVQAGGSA
jgi:Gas vesicle protein